MFILIRHPRTSLPSGICYGRLDADLAPGFDPRFIVRALATLETLTLWSSPATRCRAVADAISAACRRPVRCDQRLRELDFGDWEGRPWAAVPHDALDRWAADPEAFAPPGGETGRALILRVREFHAEASLLPGAQVIVSHGGPLRLLAALARGQKPDLLMPPPALGSLEVIGSTSDARRDDAEHGALGNDHARA